MRIYLCKAVALGLFFLLAAYQFAFAQDVPVDVGDYARLFLCRDVQGDPFVFNRSFLANRGCVLSFFTPQCEPCLEELPALANLLSMKFPEITVLFIGIDPFSNSNENLRTYLRSLNIISGGLFDLGGRICLLYGVKVFPTIIVVDREMRIAYRKSGYEYGDLESIERVLAEMSTGDKE